MIHPIERMTYGRLIKTARSYAELDAYIEGVLKRDRVMFEQDSFHVDVMSPDRNRETKRAVELTGQQASDAILNCTSYSFPGAWVEIRERKNATIVELHHNRKPASGVFGSEYGKDEFVIRECADAFTKPATN